MLAASPLAMAAEHAHEQSHEHASAQAHGHEAHWTYEGENGPQNWGNLKSDFAMCKTGKSQSPINITVAEKGTGNIAFSYQAGTVSVTNNGHTIQANVKPGSFIILNGKSYDLLQFHFHAPSENTVSGKPFDMELHFVNKSEDGNLAVVGVFLAGGSENAELKKLWAAMPAKAGESADVEGVDPNAFLPKNRAYWAFEGSLTTPPCSEHVAWNVMKNTIPVNKEQVQAFTKVIGHNARPVQPLHTRKITLN